MFVGGKGDRVSITASLGRCSVSDWLEVEFDVALLRLKLDIAADLCHPHLFSPSFFKEHNSLK